jgi:hypothetical protein
MPRITVLHPVSLVARSNTLETVTRTVRFKKTELERIERFLEYNPLFDFSTLVRHSVEHFMLNPSVAVKPLTEKSSRTSKGRNANV